MRAGEKHKGGRGQVAQPGRAAVGLGGKRLAVDGAGQHDVVQARKAADLVAVAVHAKNAVALKRDGTLVAWGTDDSGQAPATPGLTEVISVAAGADYLVVGRPVTQAKNPREAAAAIVAEIAGAL